MEIGGGIMIEPKLEVWEYGRKIMIKKLVTKGIRFRV